MKSIQEAKDPDLRASVAAMNRAAEDARKIAIQTGTENQQEAMCVIASPNELLPKCGGHPRPKQQSKLAKTCWIANCECKVPTRVGMRH